jgi:threonine dehydrogenase-like Zn-dependent dehydrogenase
VLVEPAACAVHGALSAPAPAGGVAAVIGAGTLGLLAVAALRSLVADAEQVIVGARYAHQRRLATALGATAVAGPGELGRAVRRATGTSMLATGQLTGGAGLVLDCVGSAASLTEALALAAPGATIVLLGMPGPTNVDLTALWQREITLVGSYTYGPEPAADGRHSFDLAFELAARSGLERLLSATYSLDRFPEAMEHAASAGRRGAVKVAFDLRGEKHRQR